MASILNYLNYDVLGEIFSHVKSPLDLYHLHTTCKLLKKLVKLKKTYRVDIITEFLLKLYNEIKLTYNRLPDNTYKTNIYTGPYVNVNPYQHRPEYCKKKCPSALGFYVNRMPQHIYEYRYYFVEGTIWFYKKKLKFKGSFRYGWTFYVRDDKYNKILTMNYNEADWMIQGAENNGYEKLIY